MNTAKEDFKQHVVIDIVTAWAGTIGYGGTLPLGGMCNGSVDLGEGGKVYGATRRCAPRRVSPRASASDSPHASTMSDFASATAVLDGPPTFSRAEIPTLLETLGTLETPETLETQDTGDTRH